MTSKPQDRIVAALRQRARRELIATPTASELQLREPFCCVAALLRTTIEELRKTNAAAHTPQAQQHEASLTLRPLAQRTSVPIPSACNVATWMRTHRNDPVLKKTWDKPTPDNIAVVRRPRKKGLTYCQISLTALDDQGIDILDDRATPLDSLLDAEGARYDFDAEEDAAHPGPALLCAMARSAACFTATAGKPTEHVNAARTGRLP